MQLRHTLSVGLLVGLTVGLGGLLHSPTAEGQRGLRAAIYLTQKRIPRSLTEARLLRFVRQNKARTLQESQEEPLSERYWRAKLVTRFNRPPGDYQYDILFFDVSGSDRRLVETMSSFVNGREQRTFVQSLRLDRGTFKPNRRYEVVVSVGRQVAGRSRVLLAGEVPRRSGVVTFSDRER